jgi:hypothetical protein
MKVWHRHTDTLGFVAFFTPQSLLFLCGSALFTYQRKDRFSPGFQVTSAPALSWVHRRQPPSPASWWGSASLPLAGKLPLPLPRRRWWPLRLSHWGLRVEPWEMRVLSTLLDYYYYYLLLMLNFMSMMLVYVELALLFDNLILLSLSIWDYIPIYYVLLPIFYILVRCRLALRLIA